MNKSSTRDFYAQIIAATAILLCCMLRSSTPQWRPRRQVKSDSESKDGIPTLPVLPTNTYFALVKIGGALGTDERLIQRGRTWSTTQESICTPPRSSPFTNDRVSAPTQR
jgi:hypothetical protein